MCFFMKFNVIFSAQDPPVFKMVIKTFHTASMQGYSYTANSTKVVARKAQKCMGQDPKVVWVFT